MNAPSQPHRKAPVLAGLSSALPLLGIVLTYIVVSLPALRGTGDFASFAPAIGACLAAFPLSFLGLGLAVAAVVRKEKWRAIVILGVLLNLILLLVSAPLVWTALQR